MVGAGAAQRRGDLVALLLRRPRRSARGSRRLRVSTCTWRPGLGVDEPEVAGGHELLLARVDGSRPPSRRGARAAPAAAPPSRARRGSRRRSRRARAGGPAPRSLASAVPSEVAPAPSPARARGAARPAARAGPRRPWRGRMTRGSPPPNASTPSRLPRRVATWPTASATPSATSALRRSAVPNAIEADDVEHQPGRQRPLAHVHAHVRLLQARGRVPVDVAHVVAGEVRADHRQLGALADLRRQVLAGDAATRSASSRRGRASAGPRAGRARGRARPASARARAGRCRALMGAVPRAPARSPAPASSSTSAPPANADVTWRFSLVLVSRVPRLR